MTRNRNPLDGKELDARFEYPIIDGPTWERLCDGLKYQNPDDHIEVRITILTGPEPEQERVIKGDVCGIWSRWGTPRLKATILFIPETEATSTPIIPWELTYASFKKMGVAVDIKRRNAVENGRMLAP